MEKEDILLLAQLYHSMQDVTVRMEQALLRKDHEQLEAAKRELLSLQRKIEGILRR